MVPYSVFAKIDKKYKNFTVLRGNIFKIPLENLLIFSFQKILCFKKISLYRLRSHDFMVFLLYFLGSKQRLSGHYRRNSKLYLSFSRRWETGSITVFPKKSQKVKKTLLFDQNITNLLSNKDFIFCKNSDFLSNPKFLRIRDPLNFGHYLHENVGYFWGGAFFFPIKNKPPL